MQIVVQLYPSVSSAYSQCGLESENLLLGDEIFNLHTQNPNFTTLN